MKISRWIVTLVLALVVCGSVTVKADDDDYSVYVVNKDGYHECTSGVGHYYVWNRYTRHDTNYHYMISTCKYCGDCREVYTEHRMENDTTYATPKKAGIVITSCKDCEYVSARTPIQWRYGEWGSTTYDVTSFTPVFKDSTSITVKLRNGIKGAVLKVIRVC